jgi:hypothetical protein
MLQSMNAPVPLEAYGKFWLHLDVDSTNVPSGCTMNENP